MKRSTHGKRRLAALAFVLVLGMVSLVAVALADNVVNDVAANPGSDTITAGGSTTVDYKIVATGSNGCDAADGSPVTVTIHAPAAVSASPGSLTFNTCNTLQGVTFSSNTPGDYAITVSTSDSSGTYNTTPATFTLHVQAAPPPSDTTPPNISYVLNPASPDGDNGWYKGNVSLTWTVTENESPGSLVKTGCVDQNITADQAATTYSCSATSDGGSAGPVSVTIKRDGTAPNLQLDPTQDSCDVPGDNGWCRGTQTAGFKASDATSGLADPSQASFTKTSSTNGSNVNIASGTVKDNAGNVATSIDAGPFKIDSVKPDVSVTGVQDGATYTLGSVPTAGCDTADATSGVATNATLSTSGGPVGSVTATCSGAKDNAGNTNSASVTYSVIYNWTGFFSPVDNPDTLNVAKAGSAIPVKFSLSGNQGLNIFAPGYPKMSGPYTCDTGTPSDAIEQTVTAGASSLQYDATTDQYIYVWKTDKSWAGKCGQLQVKLVDGTTHVANFKLTK